eukprot:TRINITY_DN2192_c0_g1_i2.p1 TRINITY_DN2192_c0_g1~~TRINITY_DN2192_c0_g1_i2.p1  ORF type:complete len:102 (-),score=21.89 TRINITY_DN2192_c0_g1_i2:20-325(-)
MDCSHYMIRSKADPSRLRMDRSKKLFNTIKKEFGTLAFCPRWLDRIGEDRYNMTLKNLCDNNVVRAYPPLCDERGSHVSQFEHTFYLGSGHKEILSVGDDY